MKAIDALFYALGLSGPTLGIPIGIASGFALHKYAGLSPEGAVASATGVMAAIVFGAICSGYVIYFVAACYDSGVRAGVEAMETRRCGNRDEYEDSFDPIAGRIS